MAKVVVGGNKKGKVGNSIFYTIKNSNNKVTQGERIYQPDVTNPQSELQRAQRMKMKPASNFYNALSDILDHSWQGVKYGAMSRQYFLKLAMSANQQIFPFLLKGSNQFVPGPYPVSKGSLASISWDVQLTFLTLYPSAVTTLEGTPTVGWVSSQLLASFSSLQVGDQITFIQVIPQLLGSSVIYSPSVDRFIIDPNNEDNINDVLANWTLDEVATGELTFTLSSNRRADYLAAAAVIVSRKNTNSGEVWQRSTEYMQVAPEVLQAFMTPAAYAAALNSYLDSQRSYDSDYYLNDAETPSDVSGDLAFDNVSVQLVLGSTTSQVDNVAIAISPTGGVQAVCLSGRMSESVSGGSRFVGTQGSLAGSRLVVSDVSGETADQVQIFGISYNGTDITNKGVSPAQFVERFPQYSL